MKNYTSTVPASRSIFHIENFLAKAGALNISKHYKDGGILSLFFQIENNGKIIPFKLPANVEKCYLALRKQVRRPRPGTEKKLKEQAERTAWKIISDWVEIQMSLIEMEQAEFMEIFLPYVFLGEHTFYERIKGNGFKMLSSK